MKKVIVCLCAYLIVVASSSLKVVSADEAVNVTNEMKIANHISGVYKQIDFGKFDILSFEVFEKAYRGYLNLRNAGKLSSDKDIISICNFDLPSTANRLWVIDLSKNKVMFNTYVAHGQGSGDDRATAFSNSNNSHQSSLGFFVTSDTYTGEHGNSLHLNGMDAGYNDAALERCIVVHAADYVSEKYIRANKRLGRSWGCPAISPKLAQPIINTIKEGTCMFIYYPESRYLNNGYWLNKKIAALPADNNMNMNNAVMAQNVTKQPATRIVQYMTNGTVDSVKKVSSL